MVSQGFVNWWNHFKLNGDICPIQLGMSRDQVRAILGAPDYAGGTSRTHREPAIWNYEDLEFHFGSGSDDGLQLIYLERDEVTKVSISSFLGVEQKPSVLSKAVLCGGPNQRLRRPHPAN